MIGESGNSSSSRTDALASGLRCGDFGFTSVDVSRFDESLPDGKEKEGAGVLEDEGEGEEVGGEEAVGGGATALR